MSQICILLAFTVPTSWSLVLGAKAGGILGGIIGLIIGLLLGWTCNKAIVATAVFIFKPRREERHTDRYWISLVLLICLASALWIIGFTLAGVAVTQFLIRHH